LALKVFAFLQQVDLNASATTSALDSLNATWRLLSEITSTQQM
jgi:hypothetical protein